MSPKGTLLRYADEAERAASHANEFLSTLLQRCEKQKNLIADNMRLSREYRDAAAKLEAAK